MEHKQIVLVGAGHGHLELLRLAQKDQAFLSQVTLISDEPKTYYSGMLASWLEGIYSDEDVSVDLEKLSKVYKIPFICKKVSHIDCSKKMIVFSDGGLLGFDLISFDIGSMSKIIEMNKGDGKTIALRPFSNLVCLKKDLERYGNHKIAVLGSGVAAVEVACGIASKLKKDNGHVTLVCKDNGTLPGAPQRLRKKLLQIIDSMDNLNIKRIKEVEGNLENDWPDDWIIQAIGSKASDVFIRSALEVDDQGYLRVLPTLQNPERPWVFGVGDCIAIQGLSVAKNGVNAIREAPILMKNLKIVWRQSDEKLESYHPRPIQLAIYSTGGKTALLHYGPLIWNGRIPWLIKNHIDVKYMQRHKKINGGIT